MCLSDSRKPEGSERLALAWRLMARGVSAGTAVATWIRV